MPILCVFCVSLAAHLFLMLPDWYVDLETSCQIKIHLNVASVQAISLCS
jgi:hypothetical protein